MKPISMLHKNKTGLPTATQVARFANQIRTELPVDGLRGRRARNKFLAKIASD